MVLVRERAGQEPRRAFRRLVDHRCPPTATCWPGSAGAPTALLGALREAGPDAPCWAWWDDPTPHTAGAVARHQAQEAAVHRWDAEGSVGLVGAVAARRLPPTGCPSSSRSWSGPTWSALRGAVTLHALDTGESWQVGAGADGTQPPARTAELNATASDLVLMLYRRLPVPDADVDGDPILVASLLSLGRHVVTELTFLGTGNFLAPPGRYWNSFVMDSNVLVEPCPTALPHLRRCGFDPAAIDVVVISHFHADHCFGWPFFLQADGRGRRWSHAARRRATRARGAPGRHDRGRQGALHARDGPRAPRPPLRRRRRLLAGSRRVCASAPSRSSTFPTCAASDTSSSGATGRRLQRRRPALRGLTRAGHRGRRAGARVQRGARRSPHAHGGSDVRDLQAAHPDVHFVLTHLGEQVDTTSMPGVTIPEDFERLTV